MPYQLGSARSAANESLLCPGEQSVQPEQGSTRHKISGPPWTGKAGTAHRPAKKTDSPCEGLSAECGEISGVELQEGGGQAFKERLID